MHYIHSSVRMNDDVQRQCTKKNEEKEPQGGRHTIFKCNALFELLRLCSVKLEKKLSLLFQIIIKRNVSEKTMNIVQKW